MSFNFECKGTECSGYNGICSEVIGQIAAGEVTTLTKEQVPATIKGQCEDMAWRLRRARLETSDCATETFFNNAAAVELQECY